MSLLIKLIIAHPRHGRASFTVQQYGEDEVMLKLNKKHWRSGYAAGTVQHASLYPEVAESLHKLAKPLWRNPALVGPSDHIDFTGSSFFLTLRLMQGRERNIEAYSGTAAGSICEALYELMAGQFELAVA